MSEEDVETLPTPPVQSAPAELKKEKPLDFSTTIARMEKRAVAARKRARWAGALLIVGAYGAVSVLVTNLFRDERSYFEQVASFSRSESRQSAEAPFVRRVAYLMNRLIGPSSEKERAGFLAPSKDEAAILRTEIKEALVDLEKAVQIADIGKKADSQAFQIAPVVSTAVFSLGAIGILVLMIQISVMFIRYHLRLAELYDAQADALRASEGNATLAYALLQHFSPNAIEVGKSPTSMYEKAFETIQAVAKRPSAP